MGQASDQVRLLLAVAVVIGVSRLVGMLVQRLGQPRVNGELLAGVLLGPSLFGAVWPAASDYVFPASLTPSIKAVAEIGIVLFMFIVGLEFDADHLRRQSHRAVVISHASIIVPFAMGALLAVGIHARLEPGSDLLGFTLFMGVAMSITAFPVLARILQETRLSSTRIGSLAITCAAVDDATAWCILAVVVAVVNSTGPGDVIWTVALAAAFAAFMLVVVRRVWARLPRVPLALAVCSALLAGWTTDRIGIHVIFGAFMAGLVIPRGAGERLLLIDRLEPAVVTLLLPVFFVSVGLSTRIDALDSPELWAITVLVVLVAIAGKLGGAVLAARLVGENWRDAGAIGILMNTRGLTEIVVLTAGLQLGVIGPELFTIMVVMALVTTFMATPLLAYILPETRRSRRGARPGRSGHEFRHRQA